MMRSMVMAATAALVVACGSGGSSDDGGPEFCAAGEDRTDYPDGPYGTEEGDILEDLSLVLTDDTPTSLGELRSDGSVRMLFIATAAGWCTACIEEQPTLRRWHEEYADDGLSLLVSVFEDQVEQPATAAYAAQWANQYDLEFTVVADPPFVFEPYYPSADSSVTPLNLVVNACTMEIVKKGVGTDETEAIEAIFQGQL